MAASSFNIDSYSEPLFLADTVNDAGMHLLLRFSTTTTYIRKQFPSAVLSQPPSISLFN